jgi:hypothetical protein
VTSLAADNFNRADAATLGTSSSGHLWTSHGTPFTLSSNAAHPPSGITDYTIDSLNGGTADVTVSCTITPRDLGHDFDAGLAGRVVDNNNFVFLDISRSGSVLLTRTFQRVGGSFTGLTSLVNPIAAAGTPMLVELVLSGDAGESFIDGVSMGSFSGLNGALLTPTRHGIVTSLTDPLSTFDDFNIDGVGGPDLKTGSDVGHLAEAYTLLRTSSGADVGHLGELVQALQALLVQRSDAGRLAEQAGLVVALTASDAGRGADSRLSLAAVLSGADAGSGRDTLTGAATLTAFDLARFADVATLVATGLQMLAASDAGRFAELADLVVVGLDHGHISDRSAVRSRMTDRTVTRSRALVRGLN